MNCHKRNLRWFVEAVFVTVISLPVLLFPYRASLIIGKMIGHILFVFWRSRRDIAIQNIRTAHENGSISNQKDAESIAKECFQNLGKSFVEMLRIYLGNGHKIIDSVEIKGIENVVRARSKGKGILFLTGHCGNWELMALAFSAKYGAISCVARAQNNPYFNKVIETARTKYGNNIIYKTKALKKMLSLLKTQSIVAVLIDQAVSQNEGHIVDFLGRGAWTTKIPAIVARKTGAAVIFAFIHREEDRHIVEILPEVNLSRLDNFEQAVKEDMRMFNRYIELYVKEHPAEWLWLHKRWKRVA